MNDDTIRINSNKSISSLLSQVETEILNQGGKFKGTDEKGQFSGKTVLGQIQGEYHVAGQEIIIRITKKPFLVPMSKITFEVQSYFQG